MKGNRKRQVDARLLARLGDLISEAIGIRSEAEVVPGEWKENWATRQSYRTKDLERLDGKRFIEWRTKCAALLSELVPKGHHFERLMTELTVLPCSSGHLDNAISALKGVRAHFSSSLAGGPGKQSAQEGRSVRSDRDYEDEQDEEESPVAGVGMPVGPDSEEVFAAICDECEGAGFEPLRVDLIPGSARITDKFNRIVREAAVMILDLTGLRWNVAREVGIVEAKHAEDLTILLARDGTDLPSDVASRSVTFYKSTEDLRRRIRPQLEAMREWLEDEDDDEE